MDDNKWLKEAIDKLDAKVDRLDQRLDNVDVTLEKQHGQLSEHMLRTELAEENISILRDEFKPVEQHVVMINGVLKAIGLIALVLGLVKTVIEIYKSFPF